MFIVLFIFENREKGDNVFNKNYHRYGSSNKKMTVRIRNMDKNGEKFVGIINVFLNIKWLIFKQLLMVFF